MEDDGVDHRVFGCRFMEIDPQVDPLFFDELYDTISDSFREISTLLPWVATVQISDFCSWELLSRRIHVKSWVWPLVNRVGQTWTVAEKSLSSRSFKNEILGAGFLGIVMGKTAVIRSRNNDDLSPLDFDIFRQKHSRDETSRLVGMSSS